jgi:hypothetical protein
MTKPTMSKKLAKEVTKGHISPFEQIRRTNDAGNEYWSSRDFAQVLDHMGSTELAANLFRATQAEENA